MLQKERALDTGSDSNFGYVSVKPRPYVQAEIRRDFFERQPHMSMENWDDAVLSWQVRFDDVSVLWSPREQRKHALQSLRDIKKFRGDDRFPQNVLNEWETKINAVLEQAEKV